MSNTTMNIPDHVWDEFEGFVTQHSNDFYRELKIGEEDEGTATDEGCRMYHCIINRGQKPTVNAGCRAKHTYYDWDTRKRVLAGCDNLDYQPSQSQHHHRNPQTL